VDTTALPRTRTVVHVVLTGIGGAEGWLDIDRDGMTVCKEAQGKDVDLVVEGDAGQMYKWQSGIVAFRELVPAGHARLIGPSRIARAFPLGSLLRPSGSSSVRRRGGCTPGRRDRKLSQRVSADASHRLPFCTASGGESRRTPSAIVAMVTVVSESRNACSAAHIAAAMPHRGL
jgi:hypothetical protein